MGWDQVVKRDTIVVNRTVSNSAACQYEADRLSRALRPTSLVSFLPSPILSIRPGRSCHQQLPGVYLSRRVPGRSTLQAPPHQAVGMLVILL